MKQNLSDKGLKKAMLNQPMPNRLSSNFTFRTMLKVEEMIRAKEKKQERRMLIIIISISCLLLAGSGITIAHYWGSEVAEAFASFPTSLPQIELFSSPYWLCSVIFFILMGFDYWMRKHYHKKHLS